MRLNREETKDHREDHREETAADYRKDHREDYKPVLIMMNVDLERRVRSRHRV